MAFNITGPSSISVEQGKTATATIFVGATGKPLRNVILSLGSLPPGLTGNLTPSTGKPSFQAKLTLAASASAAVGTWPIQIKAWDARGSKVLTMSVTVIFAYGGGGGGGQPFTADVWVAKAGDGGSDSNDGLTESTPKLTVNAGIAVLNSFGNNASKVMVIKQGSYSDNIDTNSITIPSGSSYSNAATIRAYPGHTVTITHSLNLVGAGTSYVKWQDLHIATTNVADTIGIGSGAGNQRFTNCEITNGNRNGQGVHIGPSAASGSEFIDCEVHHNGSNSGLDHGYYIEVGPFLIRGGSVHNNADHNVQIFDSPVANVTVEKCEIYSPGEAGGTFYCNIVVYGTGHKIFNNVIRTIGINSGGGIYIENASSVKMYHNTIYDCVTGIEVAASANVASNEIKNNLFRSNTTNINGGGSTSQATNRTSDPGFVSAPTNLHITVGDNSGTDLTTTVPDDKDGVTRSSTPEPGCYEI